MSESKARQRGFTLFELLIVLSIMAATASLAGASYRNASPRLALNSAASQLVTDLKAARLHARQTGALVQINPDDTGYEIPELSISRTFHPRLTANWESEASALNFSDQFTNLGGSVILEIASKQAVIRVYPITGKIAQIES